jgi:hypothetical protein
MPLKKLGATMFFLRMGDIQSKISSVMAARSLRSRLRLRSPKENS